MKAFLVMSACLALAKSEAPLAGYQYNSPAPARLSSYQNDFPASALLDPQQYQHYSQQYEPQGQQYAQQYSQPIQHTQQYTQQYEQPEQEIIQQYAQYPLQQGVTQVHKHVYVHVAPEDPEPARVRSLPIVAPPQKHYKIIFVKAPSAPAPSPLVLPQQAQSEEKTIVYVLSKKADEQEPLVLPTPASTQPSKPEVYFIKYKTQKEHSGIYGDVPPLGDFDQGGLREDEDRESITVDSAQSGRPVPARISAPTQLSNSYGTPEFQ